jgi:hypothetical protein
VHLPYVETVPAVPTGCFCSKIKFHYLTPLTDTRLVDLGTFRSTDVETTLPAGFRRVVSQHGRRNAHLWAGG